MQQTVKDSHEKRAKAGSPLLLMLTASMAALILLSFERPGVGVVQAQEAAADAGQWMHTGTADYTYGEEGSVGAFTFDFNYLSAKKQDGGIAFTKTMFNSGQAWAQTVGRPGSVPVRIIEAGPDTYIWGLAKPDSACTDSMGRAGEVIVTDAAGKMKFSKLLGCGVLRQAIQTSDGGYMLSNEVNVYRGDQVLKLDAEGNEVWHKELGYFSEARLLMELPDGRVFAQINEKMPPASYAIYETDGTETQAGMLNLQPEGEVYFGMLGIQSVHLNADGTLLLAGHALRREKIDEEGAYRDATVPAAVILDKDGSMLSQMHMDAYEDQGFSDLAENEFGGYTAVTNSMTGGPAPVPKLLMLDKTLEVLSARELPAADSSKLKFYEDNTAVVSHQPLAPIFRSNETRMDTYVYAAGIVFAKQPQPAIYPGETRKLAVYALPGGMSAGTTRAAALDSAALGIGFSVSDTDRASVAADGTITILPSAKPGPLQVTAVYGDSWSAELQLNVTGKNACKPLKYETRKNYNVKLANPSVPAGFPLKTPPYQLVYENQAEFTVPADTCEFKITFSSYAYPENFNPFVSGKIFKLQTLFDGGETRTIPQLAAAHTYRMGVTVPPGVYWQTDLYLGDVVAALGKNGHAKDTIVSWYTGKSGE